MENNRKRILGIVKNNIVNKLMGRGATLEDKKQLLEKELARNTSLFLGSERKKELVIEEREFILSVLKELGWSKEVADERLGRIDRLLSDDTSDVKHPEREKFVLSVEKMLEYPESYKRAELKVAKEIEEIKYADYESKKYDALHYRLMDIESSKGKAWKEDEIKFVVEKRNLGYTFRTIATILKRPERTVALKYHEKK